MSSQAQPKKPRPFFLIVAAEGIADAASAYPRRAIVCKGELCRAEIGARRAVVTRARELGRQETSARVARRGARAREAGAAIASRVGARKAMATVSRVLRIAKERMDGERTNR